MRRITIASLTVVICLLSVVIGCGDHSQSGAVVDADSHATAPAGTDVVTHHNDVQRTGQNLTEISLTPANVTLSKFGLLRKLTVTGKVDAQPLYLSHLNIGGAVHNVVFVATEHALMYAFDADSGAQLWQVSLLGSNEETFLEGIFGCTQVDPEIGITSTPVIDRKAGPHGTIYAVAMSRDVSNNYYQRLHALDITTGTEQPGSPADIQATYSVNGVSSAFNPVAYKERAALLLVDGIVYTTWGSHCDVLPYGGWVIGFDQTTLQRVRTLNLGNSSLGAAIWQSGGGPAADSNGNIYILTGNGAFDTNVDTAGFPTSRDFGNSFVKLSTVNGQLTVADYFSMYLSVSESALDLDLGSSGPMVLPDEVDGTGASVHLAVGAGKDGNVYVVDRDNMSKFHPDKDYAYQVLAGSTPGEVFANPAYFNHTVYYGDLMHGDVDISLRGGGPVDGSVKAFAFSGGKFPIFPTSQTTTLFKYPGASPSISANGSHDGILWATENTSPAILHAYDATNLATELYNSEMAANGRDRFGNGNKYITQTIADGKVFVGVQDGVGVFGLLP
jgi:hypothetical protein